MTENRQERNARRRGIQSVGVGLRVMRALAELGEPSALGAVAQACGLSAPQAHRYLASLVDADMAVQDPATGPLRPGARSAAAGPGGACAHRRVPDRGRRHQRVCAAHGANRPDRRARLPWADYRPLERRPSGSGHILQCRLDPAAAAFGHRTRVPGLRAGAGDPAGATVSRQFSVAGHGRNRCVAQSAISATTRLAPTSG